MTGVQTCALPICAHDDFPELVDVGPLAGPILDKFREVIVGTDNMYKLARKHALKVAFGTDLIFSPAVTARQGLMIGNMTRWYNGSETLRMVTGGNGELLALSGKRNPYPGKLGVLERGAWADLLVVDGNPLDNVALLADPDKNLKLIMKDGRIYKDAM